MAIVVGLLRRMKEEPPVDYMTMKEAAKYLRRSAAWMLRQADIPHRKGRPDLCLRRDLHDWFEKTKHQLRP
ncbi:MAG TPA: hypothetical protein PLE77_04830 [Kiritimatiellia bacterium]|nr:hypothetical protein [Kiritimatiellia bacterium]